MDTFLAESGLPALFLLSFFAATLLPLGSEGLLAVLLLDGCDPLTAVAVATTGNTLGALTTYAIGLWGGAFLTDRMLRIDDAARARAGRFYARFGSWSLLLSWLPVIGDPLCLVGGILRVSSRRFLLLVALGKLGRYVAVAVIVLQGESWLG